MRMFLQCLLVDLVAAIFFVAGIWFAWILVTANEFKWYFVLIAVLVMVIFNILTEIIWWRKK